MNIKDAFPFDEFRQFQEEVIQRIVNRFSEGYEYVILECPTGGGKSVIAYTVAKMLGRAYFTTSQKMLQDQYSKDFSDMTVLKGKGNYICVKEESDNENMFEGMTTDAKSCDLAKCSIGSLKPADCDFYEECHYYKAVNDAIMENFATVNYFIALQNRKLAMYPKSLLVCDEAHNIEEIFMSYISFSINPEHLHKMNLQCEPPKTEDIEMLQAWMRTTLNPELKKVIKALDDKVIPAAKRLKLKLIRFYDRISFFLLNYEDVRWIYCQKEFTFKPLFISQFTHNLFALGEKKLLMSATILDKESYKRAIGLSKKQVAFIRMPSTFPVDNRIISTKFAIYSMKYDDIDESLPKLKGAVANIVNNIHPNEKGIIHTHTYRIAQFLSEKLQNPRFLLPNAKNKDEIIRQHFESPEPTILLSPSMTEGLDLKGDLSRWQIICKIPYPFLGDKQVKERKTLDPSWYAWKTCLTLVQAYGRSIRSEEDHAATYIMDRTFGWFCRNNRKRLPEWFLEAIRT